MKNFIKNKMEKTFVDWYLLGIEQESNNIFVQKVLYYIEGICRHEDLNAFEICLLVDMCLQKGNEKQKEKAKSLAKAKIATKAKEDKYKDPSKTNQIFDQVLSLTTLD